MKTPFTMQEFIDEHTLEVGINEPLAAQRIADFLRRKGFSCRVCKIEGVRARRWARSWASLPLEKLDRRLSELEGEEI